VGPRGDPAPVTRDALLGGALVLWQPARGRGYRFNLDPVLLAGFLRPAAHVLDLGAGCGVIGLLLLVMGKAARVTAVEVQPQLAELVRRNALANGVSDRVEVVEADLRHADLPRADAVVFNPPYFRLGEGRVPPDPGRRDGRWETTGTLADFAGCAAAHLGAGGRLGAIVRATRAAELEATLAGLGLAPVRRRPVQPRRGAAAQHLLVEAVPGPAAGAVEETPLVVHAGAGRIYSAEVRAWLRE
jgi:tRNA1Val (adenine37-N6)-methyltransferase